MRIFFVHAICFFLLLPCTAVFADSREENLQRLEEIETRLNDAIKAIEEKRVAEVDLLAELKNVDSDLRRKQRRLKKTEKDLSRVNREIKAQQQKLEESRKEVRQLQVQVQQRLVALYKSEEMGAMKTLFSSTSTAQLLEDYDFLARVVGHDRQLLDDYRARIKKRQQVVGQLAASKQKQQQALKQLRKEEGELSRSRQLKKKFLAAVRRDRNSLDAVVAELRKRAARINSLVNGLESGRTATYTENALFPLQKGLLPWPVKGRLKAGFGTKRHPELGTLIENHGIEITAEPGTPIKAVWDGRVAFAKRFQGFGNLLIIDHEDGYYTLYAQAEQLSRKAGEVIKQGDTVGVSGFDGAEHVYFEIRQGRTPLDPLEWVVRR